jgi:hypothetical protein
VFSPVEWYVPNVFLLMKMIQLCYLSWNDPFQNVLSLTKWCLPYVFSLVQNTFAKSVTFHWIVCFKCVSSCKWWCINVLSLVEYVLNLFSHEMVCAKYFLSYRLVRVKCVLYHWKVFFKCVLSRGMVCAKCVSSHGRVCQMCSVSWNGVC